MKLDDGNWVLKLTLIYLWGGLALDVVISILAWSDPHLWFAFFHDTAPQGQEVALLRRAAGQWTAFALAQALALLLLRRHPIWLVIMAGIRFSDIFTDLFYMLSAQPLTTSGWLVLAPLPLVNIAGVFLLMRCYRLMTEERQT
ncbi:hypothetical protein [uncultured Erythrobacter sp.]|uniref:hypothetical protein n=1 Tax=uncultured Erythrobacter sp. TaxID=263913 RepID=UPI0026032383|nr:hypothetical protein [uncultured Erythrobacter sp.]